jgi:hypothetical protein
VVGAAPGNDLVAAREAAHRLHLLGDLDRGLNGFGSAGDEERTIQIARSEFSKLAGEFDSWRCRVRHRRGIGELRCLVPVSLGDLFPAMARIHHPEAGDAIQVLAALDVVQARAFTTLENAQVVAFKLRPRELVNPDVVARGLLYGCWSSVGAVRAIGRCRGAAVHQLFGCLRANHSRVPPRIE